MSNEFRNKYKLDINSTKLSKVKLQLDEIPKIKLDINGYDELAREIGSNSNLSEALKKMTTNSEILEPLVSSVAQNHTELINEAFESVKIMLRDVARAYFTHTDFQSIRENAYEIIEYFVKDDELSKSLRTISDLASIAAETYYAYDYLSTTIHDLNEVLKTYIEQNEVEINRQFNDDIDDLLSGSENVISIETRDNWYRLFIENIQRLMVKWNNKVTFIKILYIIFFHIIPTVLTYYGHIVSKPTVVNYVENNYTYEYVLEESNYIYIKNETTNNYNIQYYNKNAGCFCEAEIPKDNVEKSQTAFEDLMIVINDSYVKELPHVDSAIIYKLSRNETIVKTGDVPYYYEIEFFDSVSNTTEYGYIAKKNVKLYLDMLKCDNHQEEGTQ